MSVEIDPIAAATWFLHAAIWGGAALAVPGGLPLWIAGLSLALAIRALHKPRKKAR